MFHSTLECSIAGHVVRHGVLHVVSHGLLPGMVCGIVHGMVHGIMHGMQHGMLPSTKVPCSSKDPLSRLDHTIAVRYGTI